MKAAARPGEDSQYLLVAFQQRNNIRQYTFKGTLEDRQKREFMVDVDLALILRYRIPMQEIPLLCRRLLEEKTVLEQSQQITLTESCMEVFAGHAAEVKKLAEQRRNWSFKPRPSEGAV